MSMENWIKKENKGLKQMQGGFHKYTLCERCNNLTGGWYGGAFVDFGKKGAEYLENGYSGKMTLAFDIYPLRIIKQVVVMMLAINPPDFRQKYPELEKFVLSKQTKYLSKENQFYCYYKFGKIARYMGSQRIVDVFKGETHLVSEIAHWPFGYVMTDKDVNELCDISFFSKFQYNERRIITLDIPFKETNNPYPINFKSEIEIQKDAESNESTM